MPGFQSGQRVYSSSTGTLNSSNVVVFQRDPTSNDVDYDIPTFWQNQTDESLWYLNSFSSAGGILQAVWVGIESAINTISDTANTPVTASTSLDTPPNNIQLTNLDGSIDILSDAPNHRIIISLVGGGVAFDSIQPDIGTNPVVADGTGLVKVLGQSTPSTSGIRITGTINELDIAMFSPFVGDFTFTGAAAAATRFLSIFNTSNTALSNSALFVTVGGSTAGNPYIGFAIPLATSWAMGIDNSDSDRFKITSAATLASAERFGITTAGAIKFNNAYTFPTADGLIGQVLVTDGAGNITFGAGSSFSSYTNVSTTPYTVLSTDDYLSVDTSALAITIRLPNSTPTGRTLSIKDRTGQAASNNITVTTPGGTVTIDGSTSYLINIGLGSIDLIFNGTNYEVY